MLNLISAKDVQELLQVDRSTVYRMAEDGRLPAIKVGRQWRFEAEAIDQWVRDHSSQPSAPTLKALDAPPPAGPLAEQLPLECVQMIQDGFADALGVMIIITDMDGRPVTEPSNPCGLFTALHAYPQVWQTCVDHWAEMAARPVLAPTFVRSSLGLLCTRACIRLGRTLQGMVFIGGVAPDNWPPAGIDIEQLAESLSLNPDLLEPYLTEVHYLDAQQRRQTLTQVQRIADIMSHIIDERTALFAQVVKNGAEEK
jgi:excisionase family DNA binding protein